MKKIKVLTGLAMMSTALVLGACGSTNGEGKAEQSAEENKQMQGNIQIDGSSTVFPIMEAVSEEYMMEKPDVKVTVGYSGTGGGFEKFIAGETQMSNASRPIKDEEKASLEEKGIDFTEFKLAYDGLSVVVNKDNDWVDSLTVDELKKIWVDNGKAKKWSDIRKGWPDKEIKLYSPGTDSGTYDYFDEVILDGAQIDKAAVLSEDDNVLVQGVTGEKNGIGYFGYAYYLENKDKLKVVPIDGGKGAVEPTNETIKSGEYAPLSRPLFTYAANKAVAEDEAVYDYLKFTLENAGTLSEEVGYVKLPEEEYEKALKTLEGLKK
ncbi:PstS family phosphate ABC transporter substrate-binding protein [Bacillus badius]|uniref:Phosphate-binding protein n=1 Tax=Bacillus badius TaxID=1455 RepID=A0ABR5AY88_BACBA|nr:PstS family phosphate ABC transporter substrate-binding protein [Bacillus badius]KIL75307.1 Phosphate ABC transporter, periplasmic phosphate-binding protein PstS [Bacillus badius]KIL79705.1 Phosphate ABC transporter, periplasmic phosphate-binding protein PstS [Bacillus badius]KZN98826.1 phosphate-binding protein [Bacillus badius]KZR60439.1 phosphate-binding protein [Bacillus badius]MED0664743.1 PstS family phosphate ABC transporter substrate-binding protein [Bacillus badius]